MDGDAAVPEARQDAARQDAGGDGAAGDAGSGRYDFAEAEPRWQREWAARALLQPWTMCPADGSPEILCAGDVPLSFQRQDPHGACAQLYPRRRGGPLQARARVHSVMHPMGWDAFGLPAENAARERGIHPGPLDLGQHRRDARGVADAWASSIDWAREFATCEPVLLRAPAEAVPRFPARRRPGASGKESWVNWDPVDGTVLANEQVIDGKGWRSGAVRSRRSCCRQWFFSDHPITRPTCWHGFGRDGPAGPSACA